MSIEVRDVVLGYGAGDIVHGVSLTPAAGRVTGIVGPNGCGKSTLLKGMINLLRPTSGQVLVDGETVATMPPKRLARKVAMLPQHPVVPEGITVAELVSRGRHPHHGLFGGWSEADDRAVASALTETGTADLVERQVAELSGGQRQRVWIAMVLAQQTEVLLLDEPTTFLDLAHQIEVSRLVARLAHDGGLTVVQVLHDLSLAARWCDELVAMKDGVIHASGAARDVVTEPVIDEVFGVHVRVVVDEVTGTPLVIPAVED